MDLCCKYTAGMMTTPITIQRKTRASDGAGGFAETWSTILTTRAHVVGLSGYERFTSDRVNAETKDRCVIRFVAGIMPADRVLIDGLAYNITYVNDLERRKRWLVLDLSGGVAP
jgi:SPP1 family predicted phage head-tail adaptor